ncbi:ATP-dependent Clp protease ATP-binding subunit (plasmid) [Mammaliicoccus sciuri]|jgi:ATP-dependent Clp protease ATP-binding subunit ClpA|uniref:ATP-dependent Clp protease ATP-binding subunit n=1 Tax=Mammaliicoccus sciuri TaxID=1296 RepID=A0A517CM84_MAMSC|nr:AAA family ATPase [Mammaliicoccus sciuri]QDR66121.1 ATP-dependent Clp protease ATP-binding subunit [Mammaliicoccus sciuri]
MESFVENQTLFNEMNKEFGMALRYLKPSDSDIIGREQEMKNIQYGLNLDDTPVVMIIGPAGSGKTRAVEEYARRESLGLRDIHVITLDIGMLGSGETLKIRLSKLIPRLKQYEEDLQKYSMYARVILFIDEAHTIISTFGENSKEGGDILKPYLARAGDYIGMIFATTNEEYIDYFSNDIAMDRRFEKVWFEEMSEDETVQILRQWLDSREKTKYTVGVDDRLLKAIIEENKKHNTDLYEPDKSLKILQRMHSVSKTDEVPIDHDLMEQVFKATRNLSLTHDLESKEITDYCKSRVKGQPLALHVLGSRMRRLKYFGQERFRVLWSALFVGTTGVGKTELAKSIAEVMYGHSEGNFIKVEMTNFDQENSAEEFSYFIGTQVKGNGDKVILLDEIEKAHNNVQMRLLPILGEGIVTYSDIGVDKRRRTHNVSVRNAIIIATSNKGHKVFTNIDKNSEEILDAKQGEIDVFTDEVKFRARDLQPQIEKALEGDKFRPELLQRFDSIVPFSTLTVPTMMEIADMQIKDMIKKFYKKGYEINMNDPVTWTGGYKDYTASDICMYVIIERINFENKNQTGARNVRRIIESIEEDILEAIDNNPGFTNFDIMTDGNCRFESADHAESRGSIIVRPRY